MAFINREPQTLTEYLLEKNGSRFAGVPDMQDTIEARLIQSAIERVLIEIDMRRMRELQNKLFEQVFDLVRSKLHLD